MELGKELTVSEEMARVLNPVDSGAQYFAMGSDMDLDKMIENRHRERWNDSVKEMEDKFTSHAQAIQEAADKFAEDLNGVQIMPIANYVIVHPFNENPFQKVQVSSSGIILSTGGLVPEYKSNESGEFEEAEQYIKVGVVVEAGPDCKWLREGDTIMWAKPAEVVIPFYNFGFKLVNETRAICVINDNLQERFKK